MRALERRIKSLERRAGLGADLDRARAIVAAYEVVRHHPEEATEADRKLVAETSSDEWQLALSAMITAGGGLEAAVRASI
jgi:hypothetical protein